MPAAGSSNLERSARVRAVVDDVISRRCSGHPIPDEAVVSSHPDLMPELAHELRALRMIDGARFVAEATQVIGPAAVEDDSRDEPRTGLPTDAFPGYELLRELHRGGQGVVYLAIQKTTRRKVAIKVMLEGPFAGARDRVRFEREVQILGSLNHPNIVAVHDSGAAPNGSFYYVMDYISGVPLDEYVRDRFSLFPLRFSAGRRGSSAAGPKIGNRKSEIDNLLVLFSRICEAVNAAHLRGVIHRDLKPGNIRIDSNGEPHVLDFGLAKVAVGDVTPDSRPAMMTTTGQFVGSLPWASPEQAEGRIDQIDVRTDVYSLGVILYQMLTDRFPYPVVGNMREVLENIVRAEPTRPSTIQRLVNDEVETIVLKCLAKERERRYQTAGEIARDIAHYRSGEPINAKRDSTWYVLKKSLRRYKAAAAVAVLFVVLITASTAWLSILYGTKTRLLGQVQEMHRFLQGMFEQLKPREAGSRKDMIKEMLASREISLGQLEPEVRASVLETIGRLYRDLGEYDNAEKRLAEALQIRWQVLPNPHPDLAASLHHLAAAHWWNGRYRLAEPLYREALAMREGLYGHEHRDVALSLTHLAACLLRLGDTAAAESFNQESLALRERLPGVTPTELAQGQNNLAKVYLDLKDYDRAKVLFERAYTTIHDRNKDDPEAARALNNIAMCYIGKRDYAGAEEELREAHRTSVARLEHNHPFVAESEHGLAELFAAQQQWAKAEAHCLEALGIRRGMRTDHPEVADSLALLGQILLATDRPDESEQHLRTALRIRLDACPLHWRTAEVTSLLGECLMRQDRYDEAEPLLKEGYETLAAKRGANTEDTRAALQRLVSLYDALDEAELAAAYRAKLTGK